MNVVRALAVSALALATLPTDNLVTRKLDDTAVISLPRGIKEEIFKGLRTDQPRRLVFTFATSYFWASFGSSTAYRQLLFVSIMAPDATDADYADRPKAYSLRYEQRHHVRTATIGSGSLDVTEGIYQQNTLNEPAYTFLYADRAKRLQIAWHVAKSEVALEKGVELIGQMAASFAIISEPATTFSEMRDRPRKEAEERSRRVAAATEMLAREGIKQLVPGTPVLKDGVLVEWMQDPEPRYQLLVPLGRVKATPNVIGARRPRPVPLRNADGSARTFMGAVGWWEFWEDEWRFHNNADAYLPLFGIAARLKAEHRDPAYAVFYYAATVRVEEVPSDRFSDLHWFRQELAEIQQLWREGKLIQGAMDEAPFPLRKP